MKYKVTEETEIEYKEKWLIPLGMWLVFEIVAVTLWLTKDNLFYLLNFSYIGSAIALGLLLCQLNYRHARRIVQLLVGLYMLVYLGLICQENMQIEGSEKENRFYPIYHIYRITCFCGSTVFMPRGEYRANYVLGISCWQYPVLCHWNHSGICVSG